MHSPLLLVTALLLCSGHVVAQPLQTHKSSGFSLREEVERRVFERHDPTRCIQSHCVPPKPTLKCVGGAAADLPLYMHPVRIEGVKYNAMGGISFHHQKAYYWEFTADLPVNVHLGKVRLESTADDRTILEYHLEFTGPPEPPRWDPWNPECTHGCPNRYTVKEPSCSCSKDSGFWTTCSGDPILKERPPVVNTGSVHFDIDEFTEQMREMRDAPMKPKFEYALNYEDIKATVPETCDEC